MKTMIKGAIAATVAALVLSGCSSVSLDDEAKKGSTLTEVDVTGAGDANSAAQKYANSIFFAFNSYTVDAQYMPVIERHARTIKAKPEARVVIEGNTDSRGSREYNLALGQKRSEAVKQRLQFLGIPASRIEAVSFGSEKPVDMSQTEAGWAKNRRADVNYR